eukprot:evm.model.scf_473.11 EVM.evm.TU.scf_473.11   scf_473:71499-75186(-)
MGGPAVAPAAPDPAKLVGPASKSYSIASTWDQSAPLTPEQLAAVDAVSAHCGLRPIPAHIRDRKSTNPTSAGGGSISDTTKGTAEEPPESSGDLVPGRDDEFLGEPALHTAQKFYEWHAKLEAARAAAAEHKYRQYAERLAGQVDACASVRSAIDDTLAGLDAIQAAHREAIGRSRALHDTGERLVEERQQLVELAEAIRSRLAFFEELERVASEFHAVAGSGGDRVGRGADWERLMPLLQRMDECIAYVAARPHYAESSVYMSRFRALQSRALGGIRHCVGQVLREASGQAAAAGREAQGEGEGGPADDDGGGDTSLMYVRFRATAELNLRGLFKEIEARSGREEYARLLGDCQAAYRLVRQSLMADVVQKRVEELSKQPIDTIVRHGFAYLIQICKAEHGLFHGLFQSAKEDPTFLLPLMDPLGTVLYDVIRPFVIQMQSVEELCSLVQILKSEIAGDQLARFGEAVEPLKPTVMRTLTDAQERLTYRAQAYIRDDIAKYKPSADDLDYPRKLETSAEARGEVSGDRGAGPGEPGEGEGEDGDGTVGTSNEEASISDRHGIDRDTWFPPLKMALDLLSRLYPCLEPPIFGGLAHEAVVCSAMSIVNSERLVRRANGPLDGQLFAIRHLLLLREQIAAFKAEFSVVEKDLDFSHMRDHLRRIMVGESSLFSLSGNNAVVQFMSRAGPRVTDTQVDSKKQLEKQLKQACESLIMMVTKATVEPMLSFLTKVTAIRAVAHTNAEGRPLRPLREQAFANPDRVAEMVGNVNEALRGALPQAVLKMKQYLPNPSTHSILYKPIKSNIAEAHAQVANLLLKEYSEEDFAQVPLLPAQELSQLMDKLN